MKTTVLLAWLLLASAAWSQGYRLAHTFVPSNSEPGDRFGFGLDLDGDTAVIRSRTTDEYEASQIHLFSNSPEGGWVEESATSIDWPTTAIWVGDDLALSGDGLVNGLPQRNITNDNAGDISFISIANDDFSESSLAEIAVPEEECRDNRRGPLCTQYLSFVYGRHIGSSVDADGQHAITSVGFGPLSLGVTTAALVYERTDSDSWSESIALTVPHLGSQTRSRSVAISRDTAIVGFRGRGNVSFHERDAGGDWNLAALIDVPSQEPTPSVLSVDVDGNWAVARVDRNEVLLFEKRSAMGWTYHSSLNTAAIAPDFVGDPARWLAIDEQYHGLIEIENDVIAYGVTSERDPHVRVYRRNESDEWLFSEAIPLPENASGFIWSLAVDQGRILIGSTGTPDTAGAAYLYVPIPEPNATSLLLTAVLSAGSTSRFRRH